MSANEAAAIGDVRTVISAQMAYASANNGYYDTLECLGAPAGCLPDYSGPVFLDTALVSAGIIPKTGYRRTLHLGPPPDSDGLPARSPSSARSFAYVAVPITPGKTGVRAFCGDDTGIVRYWTAGEPDEIEDGRCPEDGTPLG